jgi:N-methylhydantoinase A
LIGRVRAVRHPRLAAAEKDAVPVARARTWFRGQGHDACPCYDRDHLLAGHRIAGPAVIAGQDSTIVIPPEWLARCDEFGNIAMSRPGASS